MHRSIALHYSGVATTRSIKCPLVGASCRSALRLARPIIGHSSQLNGRSESGHSLRQDASAGTGRQLPVSDQHHARAREDVSTFAGVLRRQVMNAVIPPSRLLATLLAGHLGNRLSSLLFREGRGTPDASLVLAIDQNAEQ